jgi:hypothetical protein
MQSRDGEEMTGNTHNLAIPMQGQNMGILSGVVAIVSVPWLLKACGLFDTYISSAPGIERSTC